MRTISKLAILLIFVLMLTGVARSQNADAKISASVLNETKITGAWQINYAESDNPIEKMQTMMQNRLLQPATEKTTEKTNDAPAMSVSLVPPETLTIISGDEKSVTINEGFNEIVFTKTFAADGIMRLIEFQTGASVSIMAEQTGDVLKIETQSPRKNRMIEVYTLADQGKKLIVIVRFEDYEAKEIITFRRVYNRTLPDIFAPENQDFQ